MARADVRYICQRAANAIISEIGPYRVSTDALQAINLFLDEFLVLLLTSSASLDLSRIKTIVFTLLPSTLGKNAIVEAELEVKTFTETETIDYEAYERMRLLGQSEPFPTQAVLPCLRDKCFEFCTLADKEDQQQWMALKAKPPSDIIISPMVAIYVTTVLEHMAEYILTGVVIAAEHEDTEYVRIKEVFLALIDDVQVGDVFYRMDMREKMEKRAIALGYRPRNSMVPSRTSSPTPSRRQNFLSDSMSESVNGSFMDISFDDMDLGYDDDRTVASRPNTPFRPNSVMTQNNNNNTTSTFYGTQSNQKKAYKVFKKDESNTLDVPEGPSSYDPDAPAMNFEDLIRSGSTVRVSLTPNRLRSIEVKDLAGAQPPDSPSWERRSTTLPRLSTPPAPRPEIPFTQSPLEISNHSVPPLPPVQAVQAVHPTSQPIIEDPPLDSRFENPREAPKPPQHKQSPVVTPRAKRKQSLDKVPEEPKKIDEPILRRGSMSSRKSRENLRRQREKDEEHQLQQQDQQDSQQQQKQQQQQPEQDQASTTPSIPSPSLSHQDSPTVVIHTPIQNPPPPTPTPATSTERQTKVHRKGSFKKSTKAHKSTPDLSIHRDSDTSSVDTASLTPRPERPSMSVAKRASVLASRRQSAHEDGTDRQPVRLSTAGSVGLSIKAWDEISKQKLQKEEEEPKEKRRSMIHQWREKIDSEDDSDASSRRKESAVLDKVLKFEQVTSLDDYRASYVSRRERFLYLQRDPIALERKKPTPVRQPRGVDASVQTDMVVPSVVVHKTIDHSNEDELSSAPMLMLTTEDGNGRALDRTDLDSEHGMVDGDEEWFLQDDEWEDVQDQESAVVDWLLGEA
ncbi:hypothetical protein CLU79DRAFT_717033 [Phycomyces nitens]|nr:hypothetical protein CLU79DRAFT_717033 [Phycomyces nitens]